jgi:hypothetical protein
MNIKRAASVAALMLATSLGVTTATTALMPVAAHASSQCSLTYGNTLLTGDFTFSNRNVSVEWRLSAASGSGRKRVMLHAFNNVEDSGLAYGSWVAAGTRGTGALSGPTASRLPGGYGTAQLVLLNDGGGFLTSLVMTRAGTCFEER